MTNKKAIIKSKIEAIKKINDQPKNKVDDVFDLIKDDLASTDNTIRRKIDDYSDKYKSITTSRNDIFSDVINIAESFINSADKKTNNDKPESINKLREYGKEAALNTIHASKQIVTDTVQSELFSGEGICGNKNEFENDDIKISPKEFDFMNIFKISPDTTTGKMFYENDVDYGYIKMNKEFYETFNSLSYNFNTNKGDTLFKLEWDETTQKFQVESLTDTDSISKFILDYYSNIEYPNLENVIKETMYLTIHGDGSESKNFVIGMDWLNRLTKKIFSLCDQSFNPKPFNQTPANQINDENHLERYFNFQDTEGIDIDDEQNRLKRVLKFTDCNNFETKVNNSHIEDFVYFFSKDKDMNENINDTINKVVQESYENSLKTIPPINLQISLTLKYLLNLPKAIIANVLSPKIFFPIVVVYKSIKEITSEIDVLDFMKKMSKLFFKIVKKIFWHFLREFWKFLKKELLIFLKQIAMRIIKKSIKRFKLILSSLISLLTKALNTEFASCDNLYDTIINAIEAALNSTMNIPIPGVMLAFSDTASGYNTDRSYMKIVEKLTASGIPMGDLYGRENKLHSLIKGIVEGNSEEIDENGFVKISLKPGIVPITPAGGVISPNLTGSGKLF